MTTPIRDSGFVGSAGPAPSSMGGGGGATEITVETETLHDLVKVYAETVNALRSTKEFISANTNFHPGTGLLMLAMKWVYNDARDKTVEAVQFAREIAESNREAVSGFLDDMRDFEDEIKKTCDDLCEQCEHVIEININVNSGGGTGGNGGGNGGGYGGGYGGGSGGGAVPEPPSTLTEPTSPTDTTGGDDDGVSDIDINVTVDGDGNVIVDVDGDGDENVHLNVDVQGDGDVDVNIDSDLADGDSDVNVNVAGDGEVHVNVDTDGVDNGSRSHSDGSDGLPEGTPAASPSRNATSAAGGGGGGGGGGSQSADPRSPDNSAVFESGSGTPLSPEQQAKNAELYNELWEEQSAKDPMGRSADELRTAWEEREPMDFSDDAVAPARPLGYAQEATQSPLSFAIRATQGVR